MRLDLDRIHARLEALGWSQSELCRKCKAAGFTGSARTIHYVLSGKTKDPRGSVVSAIETALGLSSLLRPA